MSFIFYDIVFLLVFSAIIGIILYRNRERVKREGILFLYKTTFGIDTIKEIGQKHKGFLSSLEWVVIAMGYFSMIAMMYLVGKLVYLFVTLPELVKAVKIPPIVPLIPYLPEIFKVDFLPPLYFTYWILVLAVTAISHEFFHGIFARINNVRIKSTGFAFLGPFIGAFVEPDEKQVSKLKLKGQLSILASGTFANWLITILFFFVLWGFFAGTFHSSGVIFNTYAFDIVNTSSIQSIGAPIHLDLNGGINLTTVKINNKTYFAGNMSGNRTLVYLDSPALNARMKGVISEINGEAITNQRDLNQTLSGLKPGTEIIVKTIFNNSVRAYNITLGEFNNESYLGVMLIKTDQSGFFSKVRSIIMFFKDPNVYYEPKYLGDLTIFIYNLLWWLVFINLSVALANMMPLGIFDGGRVFFLTMKKLTGSEKAANHIFAAVTWLLIAVFVGLTVLWFFVR
jgi:membrane-associated protease RseP (regulator of RpoE activity)